MNQYTITYIIDGEVFFVDTINYGEKIVVPDVPTKEGSDFAWTDEIPETMPAEDIVVNGAYTTGIADVMLKEQIHGIYTIDGRRINRLQHGMNIVVMKDRTSKRIYMK